MGRRIGGAHVIDRVHESPSEEIVPDSIGSRLGEVRILGIGQPVCQLINIR